MEHDSLAEIAEQNLVRQLLSQPRDRSTLLNFVGFPNDARVFPEIPLDNVLGNFQGDIDLLVCAPGRADTAIAIQVKRVKVGANAFRRGTPNKLKKVREGVWQTNDLAHIGFSQVYLYLLVSVDSRENNAGQPSYAGMAPEHRNAIEDEIATCVNDLDQRAGLVIFHFVQPMDYAPLNGSWCGGKQLHHRAQAVTQPANVTAWVAQQIMQRPAL
jgi:hypothetical protein